MGDYTTNEYFYLPESSETETTGKPLFDAAFEATDAVIHGQFEAFTADDTLTEAESNKVCSNLGATGTVVLTLPQSVTAGVKFYFVVMAAYALRIDPGAAGAIYINGAKQTDDKYVWADAINESVMMVSDGNGDWVCLFPYGTWGVET
jgi:hypothetical protein